MKVRRTGFTIRVAVLIEQDGKILLVRHSRDGTDYWVVPGGRLSGGEGIPECGRREIFEETGLTVEIGPLLYLGEYSGEDFRVLDLFFLGEPVGGSAVLGYDPEDESNSVLTGIHWFSPAQLEDVLLLPESLKQAVLRDWPQGFNNRGLYIGSCREGAQ